MGFFYPFGLWKVLEALRDKQLLRDKRMLHDKQTCLSFEGDCLESVYIKLFVTKDCRDFLPSLKSLQLT